MTNQVKIEHHISHLEEKLEVLKKKVDEMERTGHYSDNELHDLKKEKLHLKDEIARFNKQIGN